MRGWPAPLLYVDDALLAPIEHGFGGLGDWRLPLNHLSALYPASRQPSPKVRALIDFLVAEYQPVPPWDRALAEGL